MTTENTTPSASAPATKPGKPLARAEAWVRHLLLKVGFGFAAFVFGSIVTGVFAYRVRQRLEESDSVVLGFIVFWVSYRLWVLVMLPLTVNLVTRFFPLAPVSTAVIGGLTGELFQLGILGASQGLDGLLADQKLPGHAVTLAVGLALSIWAGKRGRAWADERQQAAELEAASKKKQYEEFVLASNAVADRNEQRALEKQAAEAAPGGGAPKPAESAEAQPAAAEPPKA